MANVQADRYWRGGIRCIVKRLASSGRLFRVVPRLFSDEQNLSNGRVGILFGLGAPSCARKPNGGKKPRPPRLLWVGRFLARVLLQCRCARSCVRGLPAFADKRNHLSRSFGHSMKEHDKRELSSLTDNPPPEVRYRSNSLTAGIPRCLACQ